MFFASDSRAGNGCANFVGTWDFVALSEKKHAHKIPRFRWGYLGVLKGGGGGCLFYRCKGAGICLI